MTHTYTTTHTTQDLIDWFRDGMKREILPPWSIPHQDRVPGDPDKERWTVLNLGAGPFPPSHLGKPLGLEQGWDADSEAIPYDNETVDGIHMYHFLEHVADPIWMLAECQRVLVYGGLLNIVVPYGHCHMALHDLTHKHFFNEDTWRILMRNPYYQPLSKGLPAREQQWKFKINTNIIMGVKGENLALFTQLVKER